MACAPQINWVEDRIANLPSRLGDATSLQMGPVAEWRPASGVDLQIFSELALMYGALGGLPLFKDYQMDESTKWRVIIGSAMRQGEMEDFRPYLGFVQYQTALMITPTEIEYEMWFFLIDSGRKIRNALAQTSAIAWPAHGMYT